MAYSSTRSSEEEEFMEDFGPNNSIHTATRIHSPCLDMQIQRYKEQEPQFSKCNIIVLLFRNKYPLMFLLAVKLHKKEVQKRMMLEYLRSMDEDGDKNTEFPFITFEDIVVATDNFSNTNMLGKGGFGKVYKVLIKSFILTMTLLEIKKKLILNYEMCRECWRVPTK